MIETLPIDKLVPAKDNPRRHLGDLTELAASIAELGVLQYPVVTANGDGFYKIVLGHRRIAAAKLAGKAELECDVKVYDSDEARYVAMVAENVGRESLSPLDEAIAFRAIIDKGHSQHEAARLAGCSNQGHVSKRLSLLELPASAQKMLDDGKLNIGQALELTKAAKVPGGVDRVFKVLRTERWMNGDYARAVDQVLEHHRRAEKVREVEAGLTKKGVTLLRWPTNGWYQHTKTARRLDDYGWDIEIKKHATLDCHAASVNPHHGDVVLLCTKPANHPQKRAAARRQTPAEKKAAEELKARRELAADAADLRREVMKANLAKRALPKGALEFLADQLVFGDGYMTVFAPVACELLGIRVPEPMESWLRSDALQPLREQTPKLGAAKVALAIAFAIGETVLDDDAPEVRLDDPVVVRHLEFLEGLGYQRADIEKPAKR